MKNQNLLYLAIVLAAAAVGWTYWQSQSAFQSAATSKDRLERCESLLQEVAYLKLRNESSIAVVPPNFDPSISVTKAAKNAGLATDTFFPNQTRLRLLEGTTIREWKVDVPPMQVNMSQAVDLIQNLAEAEAAYQVNSLKLSRKQNEQAIEAWIANINISFLKSASP